MMLFRFILFFTLTLSTRAYSQLSKEFDTRVLEADGEIRVGIAPGSFDPTTNAHRDLVLKAIETLKLDRMIIAVNVITAKDFNASVDERIEMTKRAFAPYTDKVIVVPRPLDDLNQLAEVARRSFKGPFYAVLGEDVFAKNYELLQRVPEMQFALIPRNEEQTENIDVRKYPGTIQIQAEFPGVSSSRARATLAAGSLAEAALPAEVQNFLQEKNLFENHSQEMNTLRAELLRLRASLLNADFQSLGLKTSNELPNFKAQQSEAAQTEKIIREVIQLNQLPPEKASEIRKYGIQKASQIAKNLDVGFFRGSFDPINKGQLEVIKASQEKLGLDSIVVTVINDPAKTYHLPVQDRIALVKAALRNDSRVIVVPEAPEGPVKTLKILTKEFADSPLVILGENVFAENYKTLSEVKEAKFVAIMRTAATQPPAGSHVHFAIENSAVNSKDLAGMLANPEKSFSAEVWEMIQQRNYFGIGLKKAFSCMDVL